MCRLFLQIKDNIWTSFFIKHSKERINQITENVVLIIKFGSFVGRNMATLNGGPRRTSYATASRETTSPSSAGFDHNDRKTSLKEKPSYRDEASSALHRKDDLTKIGDRLKEGKDLLNEDLSSKPWLKYIAQRKISRKESLERVSEDSSPAYDNGKS